MSGPLGAPTGLLAPSGGTPVTVEALKETLAALRAARGAAKAAAAPPTAAREAAGPPIPADFGRELARREAVGKAPKAGPPVPSPDTIPPEILPLLYDANAFAPGRTPRPSDLPAGEHVAPPTAITAPAPGEPSGKAGPLDLGRFRGEAAGGAPAPTPQPASTGSAGSASTGEAPGKPVDVDLDRLARTPHNFMPLDVLQAMKARHTGSAPLRAEAPEKASARPVTAHAR
jgi:hypothetical protein